MEGKRRQRKDAEKVKEEGVKEKKRKTGEENRKGKYGRVYGLKRRKWER